MNNAGVHLVTTTDERAAAFTQSHIRLVHALGMLNETSPGKPINLVDLVTFFKKARTQETIWNHKMNRLTRHYWYPQASKWAGNLLLLHDRSWVEADDKALAFLKGDTATVQGAVKLGAYTKQTYELLFTGPGALPIYEINLDADPKSNPLNLWYVQVCRRMFDKHPHVTEKSVNDVCSIPFDLIHKGFIYLDAKGIIEETCPSLQKPRKPGQGINRLMTFKLVAPAVASVTEPPAEDDLLGDTDLGAVVPPRPKQETLDEVLVDPNRAPVHQLELMLIEQTFKDLTKLAALAETSVENYTLQLVLNRLQEKLTELSTMDEVLAEEAALKREAQELEERRKKLSERKADAAKLAKKLLA